MLEVINQLVDYIREKPGTTQVDVVDSWNSARNRGLAVDRQCGVLFEEIVSVAVRPGFSLEYGILEVILHIGQILSQRSFISDAWWFKLSVCRYND